MNSSTAERFRRPLEQMASRLRDDLEAIAEQTHSASGGQAAGELSNAPMHLADMGTEEFFHDLNATLLENQEHLASEARAALERIDQGTFGDCEQCGESIPRARLEALPYARCCVRCASAVAGRRLNVNVGRPNSPETVLSRRGDLEDDRHERRHTGLNEIDARRTPRMDRGDMHAAGEAGGGTASGGIAGSNSGNGEPDLAELADAHGSGQFDHHDDDLNELGVRTTTPRSRQNRTHHSRS